MTLIIAISLLIGIVLGAFVKSAFKLALIAALIVGAVVVSGRTLPSWRSIVDDVHSETQRFERPTPIKSGIREAKRWL